MLSTPEQQAIEGISVKAHISPANKQLQQVVAFDYVPCLFTAILKGGIRESRFDEGVDFSTFGPELKEAIKEYIEQILKPIRIDDLIHAERLSHQLLTRERVSKFTTTMVNNIDTHI